MNLQAAIELRKKRTARIWCDEQLAGLDLSALIEKRPLDQALDAKEFA